MNNKGADKTPRMLRLICAFVVRIWHKQVFSWQGSIFVMSEQILHMDMRLFSVWTNVTNEKNVIIHKCEMYCVRTYVTHKNIMSCVQLYIRPKKQIPVFPLTRPTLRFRADSAIFIAILKKIKRLFTYRPFLCMKILDKIKWKCQNS